MAGLLAFVADAVGAGTGAVLGEMAIFTA